MGDTVDYEGKRFVVERLDRRRIRRVRFTPRDDKVEMTASFVLPLLSASMMVLWNERLQRLVQGTRNT